MPGIVGIFSVKSCYISLLQGRNAVIVEPNVLGAIQKLWKNDVPSKVSVFGWRLLLQKLPMRAALNHRGVLINPHDLPCVFCFQVSEDCSHLFFHCHFSMCIWENVFSWMGYHGISSLEGWNHFNSFGNTVKSKNSSRVSHLIWLATTWCLWKHRNDVIFNGVVPNVPSLLDNIKAHSWNWFSGRSGRQSLLSFSDWCEHPIACFQSIL
jgi:hypothetical protein